MSKLAQQILVERFIDWDRVEDRLKRYSAIRTAFPLELQRSHVDTPPYYCHCLAWRLGVWASEGLLGRFEELLAHGASLPDWEGEQSLLLSADYSNFWSLTWQLQMAEYVSTLGTEVRWGNPGPDLSVTIDGTRLFVECFVFRKSFGLNLFIEDVLDEVGHDIKVDHDYCVQFSLPNDDAAAGFLDEVLRPFDESATVEGFRRQVKHSWPVVVSRPASTLVVYFEGDDMDKYDPTIVDSPVGDVDAHLRVILKEAVKSKTGANALESHRPNLVAVNYLLSSDSHVAFHSASERPSVALPESIDGVAIGHVGINDHLQRSSLGLASRLAPGSILELVATPPPSDQPKT